MERIWIWAIVALVLSIGFHILVYFWLDELRITFRFAPPKEVETSRVEVRRTIEDVEETAVVVPPDVVEPPEQETGKLMDEIDVLDALDPSKAIDLLSQVKDPEYAVTMQKPAMAGDPSAVAKEVTSGVEMNMDAVALGKQPETIRPAAVGQMIVDPGANQGDDTMGKFTEDLIKRGAGGLVDKGTMDGMKTMDELLNLPPNALLNTKTMLPSDLLFEFNSDQLKESARVGLLKLALLMDKNPSLYCWVEGFTDLVGGEEFNLNLSLRRAMAVKEYLVKSLRMKESRIYTRGFGRSMPIVTGGTAEEQAPNRRVEIRMRKEPPAGGNGVVIPEKREGAVPVQGGAASGVDPVKAKPKESLKAESVPKAKVVEEHAPKAKVVEESIPKAKVVEEPASQAPKALPIEEEP